MRETNAEAKAVREVVASAAAGLVGAVAVVWLLHLRRLPLGVAGQWRWQMRPRPAAPTAGLAAAAVVVFLAATAAFDACRGKRIRRLQAGIAAVGMLVGSYMLALAAVGSAEGGWINATLAVCSDLSFGYFTEAVKLRTPAQLEAWLRDTARRTDRGRVPARVATHPPGPVIFVRWLLEWLPKHKGMARVLSFPLRLRVPTAREMERIAEAVCSAHPRAWDVERAAAVVWFLAAGAPAAVAGAIALGWTWRDARTGLFAGAAAAVVPGLHVFMPGIDAWAAALGVWTLAAAMWAMRGGRLWAAFVAGVLWGLGLQWTYGLLAIAPMAAWIGWRWRQQRLALAGALLVAGVALAHLPLMSMGYHPLANFLGSMRAQRAIMAQRSYAAWVVFNAWDLVLFFGPALVAVCAAAWREDWEMLAPVVVTAGLLIIAGATRGEVGRIWCFLMPPAGVAAGAVLGRLRETPLVLAGAAAAAAQLAVILAYSVYLALVTP